MPSNHNDIWTIARGTLSRETDGTGIVLGSGQSNVMCYFYLTTTDNFVIELDAIFDCNNVGTDELHFRKDNWSVQNGSVNLSSYPKDTWTHFKFEKRNGVLKIWVNESGPATWNNISLDMFVIQISSEDNYFKYKNFIMYLL